MSEVERIGLAGRVIVWKECWLPFSETFVRNQIDAYSRWETIPVGLRRLPSPVARSADVVLYNAVGLDRLLRAVFRRWGFGRRLERLIERKSGDIVHGHFVTEFAPALRAARRTGAKAIVTAHGYDVTRTLSRSRSAKLKKILHDVDGVVAVSSFIAERVIALGAPVEKVHVLPIGIPIPPPPPARVPGRVVLFVGRLSEKKGILDLLDAIDLLEGVVDRLIIVGDGPLRDRIRERSLSSRVPVEMTGALDPTSVHQKMISADVFCGPSKTARDGDSEGFGLVFLEAAAAELPVVAYSHGGVVEAVEDGVTGILCPEGDVVALADAIRHALDPAVGRVMGEAGRARVKTSFDVSERTRQLENYMDRLLAASEGMR